MASNSTINIAFKLTGDNTGFRSLAKDANGLRQAMEGVVRQSGKLDSKAFSFAAMASGAQMAARMFGQMQSAMKSLTDAFAAQQTAETKLEQVMRQRMGASADEVASIKELAAEQQKLGVIGDEVQLAGAQQMAVFLNTKDSIETLLPAMNDLIAQQDGLGASMSDAESIGKALGKAMEGNTDTLARLGITFTDAQKRVMLYGDESERAAMLAAVVEGSVGGMNAALAATDSGKQQQLANTISDVKERIGELMSSAMPYVMMGAQAAQAAASITSLAAAVKSFNIVQKAASAATKVWSGIQIVFNAIMTANPIGVIVMAVAALVAAVVLAYKHCDKFREICDKVFAVVKQVAKVVWDSLVKAFNAVSGALQKAWEWLKKFLGIKDKEVKVKVEAETEGSAPDTSGLEDKYAGYGAAVQEPKPWTDFPKSIAQVDDNLAILRERLKNATTDEARAEANALIEEYETLKSDMESCGKTAEDTGERWHDECLSINDLNDNLAVLRARFNAATTDMERAEIGARIQETEGLADAWGDMGRAVADSSPKLDEQASTLRDISGNISYYQNLLQDAGEEEAAVINRSIAYWQARADAIKNAGKEEEAAVASLSDTLRGAYGETKNLSGGIASVSDALTSSGTVWEKITGLIDGFLQIFDSFSAVIEIIRSLTAATQRQGEAAELQGVQEAVASQTAVSAKTAEAGANIAEGAAAQTAATGEMTLAAAETMSAHASIPFAGIAIAAAMVATMVATLLSLPKLASGGLATGPTLAMVGEYGGASGNPEVIAPLSKLRGMLDSGDRYRDVEFRIEGRQLVGILNKENKIRTRS